MLVLQSAIFALATLLPFAHAAKVAKAAKAAAVPDYENTDLPLYVTSPSCNSYKCQVTWKVGQEIQVNWLNAPAGDVDVQLESSTSATKGYYIAKGVPGTMSYTTCDGGTGFGQKGGKPCGAVRIKVPAAWAPGKYGVAVHSVASPKIIGYTDTVILSGK